MADTITVQYDPMLDVVRTLDLSLDLSGAAPRVTEQISDAAGTFNAGSTVPVAKEFSDDRALAAGVDSIDLTAAPYRDGQTQSFAGLKVQHVKIVAAAANTAGIVFAPGSSNGYALFGDADGQVTVLPGCEQLFYWADQLGDVGSGARNIGVSSADADAEYSIIITAG